jgi:hypothetical protein
VPDLGTAVRQRLLASIAVGGDCYSLGYSAPDGFGLTAWMQSVGTVHDRRRLSSRCRLSAGGQVSERELQHEVRMRELGRQIEHERDSPNDKFMLQVRLVAQLLLVVVGLTPLVVGVVSPSLDISAVTTIVSGSVAAAGAFLLGLGAVMPGRRNRPVAAADPAEPVNMAQDREMEKLRREIKKLRCELRMLTSPPSRARKLGDSTLAPDQPIQPLKLPSSSDSEWTE